MAIGKLLDYSQATPNLTDVKNAGYEAIFKYVCSDIAEAGLPGKRLTPAYRDSIFNHGLDIGLHGEDEAGAVNGGRPRGLAQGRQWGDYARRVLGAPAGMAIVPAIDVDIDHDGDALLPQFAIDYIGGVHDGLAEFDLVEGTYGEYSVITGAHGAGLGNACYVMTNAWDVDSPPPFCHLHQHGGDSRFSDVDYNDVLIRPYGSWLQTLKGDDMSAADVTAINQHTDQVLKRLVPRAVALALTGNSNAVYTTDDLDSTKHTGLDNYAGFTLDPVMDQIKAIAVQVAAGEVQDVAAAKAILAAISGVSTGGNIDPVVLGTAIADTLDPRIAKAVADEISARLNA